MTADREIAAERTGQDRTGQDRTAESTAEKKTGSRVYGPSSFPRLCKAGLNSNYRTG